MSTLKLFSGPGTSDDVTDRNKYGFFENVVVKASVSAPLHSVSHSGLPTCVLSVFRALPSRRLAQK